ncbi:MAG: hypothetical protein SVS85_01055 [Candidatus Nanohaloarchaea archaeon]|nr:hypothetical protein [Candidatus Nanohaloarchaea archaeon]
MDLRILAAVFITLSAVAVGMAHGNLRISDLGETFQGLEGAGGLTQMLEKAGRASPNSSVSGSLKTSERTDIDVQTPAVLLFRSGISGVEIGGSTVKTEENASLKVKGFRGSVKVSPRNMSVQGSITGVSTPSFEFVYSSPKEFSAGSSDPDLSIRSLEGASFRLENATGTVTASGTTVQVDSERAWIQQFYGNLSIEAPDYRIEGRMGSAKLGDADLD